MRFCSHYAAVILAVLIGLPAGEAQAQQPQTDLWNGDLVPCEEALEKSAQMNGPQLFRSTSDCAKEDREADALFLHIVGQVRSQTDMALLQPRDDIDGLAVTELYSTIYYRRGGVGPRHLYQDSDLIARIFERVQNWRPAFPSNYSPGWNYRPSERHALYAKVANEVKEGRLAQLKDYAALAADPHYVALEGEIKEIRARHPRGIATGTEDYKRFTELYREINRISRARAVNQSALAGRTSVLAGLPPELKDGEKQIFTGFNGPEKPGSRVFTAEPEARASWLGRALTEDQLDEVLAQVNFAEEVLVVVYFGRRTTATGTAYFSGVSNSAVNRSWHVAGRVGVRKNGCPEQEDVVAVSHPFVLGVAPKPNNRLPLTGRSFSNFGDGCKPPVSGEATPE